MPNLLDLPARFQSRIFPEPNTGCWLWEGAMRSFGYGEIAVKRIKTIQNTRLAHRAIFMMLCGPIPDGMVLDHVCRVRSCVNPDHLRIVDRTTNCMENSEAPFAQHAKKTCCPRCAGPFTTYQKKRVYRGKERRAQARVCVACRNARQARKREQTQ